MAESFRNPVSIHRRNKWGMVVPASFILGKRCQKEYWNAPAFTTVYAAEQFLKEHGEPDVNYVLLPYTVS